MILRRTTPASTLATRLLLKTSPGGPLPSKSQRSLPVRRMSKNLIIAMNGVSDAEQTEKVADSDFESDRTTASHFVRPLRWEKYGWCAHEQRPGHVTGPQCPSTPWNEREVDLFFNADICLSGVTREWLPSYMLERTSIYFLISIK